MKYKIVFKGKYSSELSEDEIIENLSSLMDQSPEVIRKKFFGSEQKNILLEKGLNNADAQEYKQAVEEAGLLVDVDLDLDMADVEFGGSNINANKNSPKAVESPNITLVEDEESVGVNKHKNIRQKFLEQQEFSLANLEDDAAKAESKRLDNLKQDSRQRSVKIEVDDRDIEVIPPLLNSGVRIGRLRFLYRITFAVAILLACLNIIPLYLQDYMGNSSFIVSMIVTLIAFMFVLIIISQRFCDIDNLSFGKMAFVFILLFTFVISLMINDFYALNEGKLIFAKQFLKASSLDPDYFEMQEELQRYILLSSQPHLLQKIDSIIKWFVYIALIIGAILLFALPGIKGNNQFGGPSNVPGVLGMMIFIVSLVALIYCGSYPYSSENHKAEHRLYQMDFYEYFGLSTRLPPEFNTAYREYLQKNSTHTQ